MSCCPSKFSRRLLSSALLFVCGFGLMLAPVASGAVQGEEKYPVYLTARIFEARARQGSVKEVTDQIFQLTTANLSADEKWLAAFQKVYPGLECALLQTHPVRIFKSPKPAIITVGFAPDRKLELLINAAQSPGDGTTPGLSIIPQIELHFGNGPQEKPLSLAIRPFEGEDGKTYFFIAPTLVMSADSYIKLVRHGAPAKSFAGADFHLIFAFSVESSKAGGAFRPFDPRQAAAVQAEATKKVEPTLPAAVGQAGLGGTVEVRVQISPDGRVAQASVFNSSLPEANQEALTAARQWEFPATLFANEKGPINGLLTFTFAAPSAPQKPASP